MPWIHPAFPGQFSSLKEMRQYMRDFAKRRKPEGYEGRIAEELISYVRQKIREERTSRLFDRDNAYLVAEDLFKRRVWLENEKEALEKRVEAAEAALTAANQTVDNYKQHWDEAEKLLTEAAQAQRENAELRKRIALLEKRALTYAKPLLALGEEELIAAVSVLGSIIPPGTSLLPAEKDCTSGIGHHRPYGYADFVSRICAIRYVTQVKDWGTPRNNSRELVRIDQNHGAIIASYRGDRPQEVLVKTTASSAIQQEFVAAYIKQRLFKAGKRIS